MPTTLSLSLSQHPSPFYLPPLSLPIIPPLLPGAPQLHQPPRAEGVAGPQQGGAVDVERGVDLGVRQQGPDGADRLEHRVRGGPGALEQVQADLARREGDVGVHHGRGEAHLRRGEGVVGRDEDGEEPSAFWTGGKGGGERLSVKRSAWSQFGGGGFSVGLCGFSPRSLLVVGI